jgi:hypothetical protein
VPIFAILVWSMAVPEVSGKIMAIFEVSPIYNILDHKRAYKYPREILQSLASVH